MQYFVEQGDIGIGLDGQMQVGNCGIFGVMGIGDDDFKFWIGSFGIFDIVKNDGMCYGWIGIGDKNDVGLKNVGIVVWWCIGFQCLFVVGNGGRYVEL